MMMMEVVTCLNKIPTPESPKDMRAIGVRMAIFAPFDTMLANRFKQALEPLPIGITAGRNNRSTHEAILLMRAVIFRHAHQSQPPLIQTQRPQSQPSPVQTQRPHCRRPPLAQIQRQQSQPPPSPSTPPLKAQQR